MLAVDKAVIVEPVGEFALKGIHRPMMAYNPRKRRQALGEALSVLNERERRLFEARRLADEPIILEELAAEFGISRERVRQIEVRAFEKVQKAVKNRVAAIETSVLPPVHRTVMAISGCLHHHT
jgi:RNA polymerase sigma factor (sigma-70 family)